MTISSTEYRAEIATWRQAGTSVATFVGAPLMLSSKRTLWGDVARRLLANRVAVVGGMFVILITLLAIGAPLVAPRGYTEQDYGILRAFPSATYWLGADAAGRDMWARIVYGARVSLLVGFSSILNKYD